MSLRDIIIAEAIVFEGDYRKILNALTSKTYMDELKANEVCKSLKCNAITIMDKEYPEYLRHMYRPPLVLFYYGDISLIEKPFNCLGVVGTREPSELKRGVTYDVVKDVCKDYIIVSGMAKGIDRVAHKSAIDNGGKTIAILGSGIDVCYPSENEDIYEEINHNHLLLSEYPNLVTPNQDHFPFRNRLIAMLSKGILVTESAIRSGTSITVNFALTYGRDVMCVPSNDLNNSGCNAFIKQGAALVENAFDIRNIMDSGKLL